MPSNLSRIVRFGAYEVIPLQRGGWMVVAVTLSRESDYNSWRKSRVYPDYGDAVALAKWLHVRDHGYPSKANGMY
jgi:hypothetical protein